MAFILVNVQRPRRGLLLLLQWAFGLRPSEAVGLRGEDFIVHPYGSAALDYIVLGRRRGTKNRRAQIARARRDQPWASWLLRLAARTTPATARVSDVYSYSTYAASFKFALKQLGLDGRWAPHGVRAGWASWRFSTGAPFTEIREDGRWASDTSCRLYLDVIATDAALSDERIQTMAAWFQAVEDSAGFWLPNALGLAPTTVPVLPP